MLFNGQRHRWVIRWTFDTCIHLKPQHYSLSVLFPDGATQAVCSSHFQRLLSLTQSCYLRLSVLLQKTVLFCNTCNFCHTLLTRWQKICFRSQTHLRLVFVSFFFFKMHHGLNKHLMLLRWNTAFTSATHHMRDGRVHCFSGSFEQAH